ncbi:LamG domain-containing protein, partial [Lutibacter sp. HS1-25]
PNPDVPYATTVNLGCLEDANNYYVIMYDRGGGVNGPGDGWDRNLPNVVSNITITSGGVTVLSNDGWTARSGGVRVNFNVSGGGVCNNPEAPGGVFTDLNLWLKADAGTNTIIEGNGITSWVDQSPLGFDAMGTGNTTYLSSFSNFNPGLNFTDDDRPLSGNISRTNGTGSTIFVVGNISTVNDKALIELGTASSRAFFIDRRYAANPPDLYSLQINNTFVWSVSDPGGTASAMIYEDGNNIHTNGTKAFSTSWSTGGSYYIGDDRSGGNRLTGGISEVIYYDRQLSLANQVKVESYLAIKYGITLDNTGGGINGDYMASSGSTPLWDASANSTYHYNVAGIGRDDDSVLNQKQSTSQNANANDITIGLGDIYTTNLLNTNTFATDQTFLMWGNNNLPFVAGTTLTVNLSQDIAGGPSTIVSFTPIQRVWKMKETNDVENVKISIPETLLTSTISGSNGGEYVMVVSSNNTFNETSTYVPLTLNGSNLECIFDFTGEQYVTFGYRPYTTEQRSIFFDDRDNDRINLGNTLNLNPAGFTISSWIKWTTGEDSGTIVAKRNDGNLTDGFEFRIGGEQLRMRWANNGSIVANLTSSTFIPDNEWHHVAAIYNGTTLYLYIDGVLDGSRVVSAPVNNDFPFYIGAAGNPRDEFYGSIDEVRIWNVALLQ